MLPPPTIYKEGAERGLSKLCNLDLRQSQTLHTTTSFIKDPIAA